MARTLLFNFLFRSNTDHHQSPTRSSHYMCFGGLVLQVLPWITYMYGLALCSFFCLHVSLCGISCGKPASYLAQGHSTHTDTCNSFFFFLKRVAYSSFECALGRPCHTVVTRAVSASYHTSSVSQLAAHSRSNGRACAPSPPPA